MILNSGVTNIKVPPYKASETYSKFDIVFFSGHPDPATTAAQSPTREESGHYYCVSAHSSDGPTGPSTDSPTGSTTKWSQNFFFEPSYGSSFSYSNSSYNIQMGDGYYSPLNKGINSLKLEANLVFQGRDDRETKAIVHLLEDSFNKFNKPTGGYSGISWTPPAPYNKYHEFYVESFDHTFIYPNVNDVSFTFKNETESLTCWQGFYVPFSGTSGFYKDCDNYYKHDITYMSGGLVDQSGWYYYSGTGGKNDHNSSPTGATSQWSQELYYFDSQQGIDITQSPRVIKKEFQNDFFIRVKDGINKSLLKFSLNYIGVTDKQAKAMVHFLESRRGNKQFLFTPPAPYNTQRVFISPSWNHKVNFKDNNELTVNFVEHPIDYTNKSNTFLSLAATIFDFER